MSSGWNNQVSFFGMRYHQRSSSPSSRITSGWRCMGAQSNDKIGCRWGRIGARANFNTRNTTWCCSVLLHPDFCRRTKTFFGSISWMLDQSLHGRWFAAMNSTCGSKGCTAGSLQMIATWVKKQRTAARLALCFGSSLILRPSILQTTLPRPCVNSRGIDVSSRFISRGTFPAARAFSMSHWDQLHIPTAWN